MQGDLARAQAHFEAGVAKAYVARVREYQTAGLRKDFDGDPGHM